MKPILFSTGMVQAILEGRKTQTRRVIKPQPADMRWCIDSGNGDRYYDAARGSDIWIEPKYRADDILWVRETWRKIGFVMPVIEYKADYPHKSCVPWKPSIYMPKEAARIWLRVTDVRAEPLQDISNEDAYAEGMDTSSCPITQYKDLWNKLNAKRGCGWVTNPYVWVYKFERMENMGVME